MSLFQMDDVVGEMNKLAMYWLPRMFWKFVVGLEVEMLTYQKIVD